MLRPLYDQKTRRDGAVSPELARALQWWTTVLGLRIVELQPWVDDKASVPVHRFCDARGEPPHLGVVLFDGAHCFYTHGPPPPGVMHCFLHRRDNQIMGLELLAISLGFCTFERRLKGRRVIIHSDNTGSEASPWCASGPTFGIGALLAAQATVRRGSAKRLDHAQLVHSQWLHAAKLGMRLHVVRVATHDNIADLPSREVCSCGRGWRCPSL